MRNRMTIFGTALLGTLLVACSGGGTDSEATESAQTASDPAASVPATGAQPAPDAAPAVAIADLTGNAAAGRAVFAQCRACHVTDPGVNRIGPTLAGVVGRQAGSVPGFSYSPANKNAGFAWTPEKLFEYLEKPQQALPGTRMIFAGISDPQQRADVIAYLQNPS